MITKDLEGIVSAIWECDNCDWKLEGYDLRDAGDSIAEKHAEENGHTVRGEIVNMRLIEGKVE